MTDLDELTRLLEQATPGPWDAAHRKCVDAMYRTEVYSEPHGVIATVHWTPKECANGATATYRQDNAALIAALRNCAEELVRDARRYRWLRDVGFRSANLSLGVDSDGQDFAEFAFEFRAPESEYQMREPEDWSAGDVNAAIDAAIAQEQP